MAYLGNGLVKGLSLEDGAATLTDFTASIIDIGLANLIKKNKHEDELHNSKILICGGGRKNKYLIEILKKKKISKEFFSIDEYDIDGDFVESQAFAYLAIRSYLKLPISFPKTTGCLKPCTGGKIVNNY